MTRLPAWTSDPHPGHDEIEIALPSLPDGLDLDQALLGAHVTVLSVLTGESGLVVGLSDRAGEAAVGLVVPDGSWRDVLDAVAATTPSSETTYDTVVGRAGVDESAHTASARLRAVEGRLRLTYDTEVLDRAAAERLAGYHAAALSAMAHDLDAPASVTSLLSDEEREHQLRGMAGPVRPLPDVRAHQLVEERVRTHPDAVAAVCADDRLTYAELNAEANRVAHGLLARGLAAEDVVAVVTERNLGWMAAVLGVLKAGGTYLPVEPHFPPARIAASLRRAECRFVLTETGSSESVDAALLDLAGDGRSDGMAPERLTVAEAGAGRPDGNPDVAVGADQRAYIYFTSGSTGEPKGAMCEHAGMLNHLTAKIEDLEIADGDVVAQTAPQCFDISLWQLLAALLVGGRTVIVPQADILDPARMVATVAAERVGVLQLVPSYLEVVLTQLDRHPVDLPDLHVVSVTGEAVKADLVRRFFASPAMAGASLVNAYGLTETSDDTNHAVLDRPPAGEQVPLGPPVCNVVVYVVDPHSGTALEPVPLGAPGEIVFSGVCVGRGYVNDPERTAAAFGSDPHRPGERTYRSGDFGRWSPDGSLEFLGRRDAQLKISGFRIELGEIESTLLRAPGVRDAAVVVVRTDGTAMHLVGFYAADQALDPGVVRDHLAASLPHYMVPAAVHHRAALPLSDNGKIDRKALAALALEAPVATSAVPSAGSEAGEGPGDTGPTTDEERRLAAIWATVLGVPESEIGRHDHFLDRGGSSLTAVKVVVALDRALTLKQVVATPVLADLARLLEDVTAGRELVSP